MIVTSAVQVARTYLGTEEVEGRDSNAEILGWLRAVAPWAAGDDIPWCGAFVAHVAMHLGLPYPKSLAARAWLTVGTPVQLSDARAEEDVVILKRGRGNQPGPEVIAAPGHVAFYVDHTPGQVHLLGGNQNDSVNISRYPAADVLGVRRLA